jgi:hypothetical protein
MILSKRKATGATAPVTPRVRCAGRWLRWVCGRLRSSRRRRNSSPSSASGSGRWGSAGRRERCGSGTPRRVLLVVGRGWRRGVDNARRLRSIGRLGAANDSGDVVSCSEDLASRRQDFAEAGLDAQAQIVAVGHGHGVDVEAHVEAAVVGQCGEVERGAGNRAEGSRPTGSWPRTRRSVRAHHGCCSWRSPCGRSATGLRR